ncbi:unnamed protein product [Albugo candida]|uniref:Uncharacterized protein n=1 Tax=Albugo candida TaxID=65357 RepID=A0A024FX53_9STRA|nr:unnamed protein product [Albugo candida]|eukprot:CCI11596.1 unnamed protein product [Albugo candida]
MWNSERSQPRLLITTKAEWKKSRNELVLVRSQIHSPVQDRNPELAQDFGQVLATFSFEDKQYLFQKVTFSYDFMRSEFPKWAPDAITRAFPSNNTDAHPLHFQGYECHAIEALKFPHSHSTLDRIEFNTNPRWSIILCETLMMDCATSWCDLLIVMMLGSSTPNFPKFTIPKSRFLTIKS